MLQEQTRGLFRQARKHVEQGRDHVRAHRQLHAQRDDELHHLQTLISALVGEAPKRMATVAMGGAIGGGGVDEVNAASRRRLAEALVMLRHHDHYVGLIDQWLNQFESLHDYFGPLIEDAMSWVPGPIWGFLVSPRCCCMVAP